MGKCKIWEVEHLLWESMVLQLTTGQCWSFSRTVLIEDSVCECWHRDECKWNNARLWVSHADEVKSGETSSVSLFPSNKNRQYLSTTTNRLLRTSLFGPSTMLFLPQRQRGIQEDHADFKETRLVSIWRQNRWFSFMEPPSYNILSFR